MATHLLYNVLSLKISFPGQANLLNAELAESPEAGSFEVPPTLSSMLSLKL